MSVLLGTHIAGGLVALACGIVAVAARKGGRWHAWAGRGFVGAMLFLWASATALDVQAGKTGAAIGNIFVAYFVLTSWSAARRRDGSTGRLEIAACAVALAAAALILFGAITGPDDPTPVGRAPLFIVSGVCLAAGLADLSAILRKRLTPPQRITRHLWRICCAFFIATGSFFLGQQDAFPEAWRGSPVLLVLAFAPFAVMVVWLVRLRFGKRLRAAVAALGEGPRARAAG